jgi:predicted fused transcriptional regulator/phosphomethylpyrimidine kinase
MITTLSYSDMTLNQLREAGYAVCIFDSEECRGVRVKSIEEAMCVAGWDAIEDMAEVGIAED